MVFTSSSTFGFAAGTVEKLGEPGNAVEADEGFIGGKPKNRHAERRVKLRAAREVLRGNDRKTGEASQH